MTRKTKENIALIFLLLTFGVMFLIVALGVIFPGDPSSNKTPWFVWALLVEAVIQTVAVLTIIGVSNRMDRKRKE